MRTIKPYSEAWNNLAGLLGLLSDACSEWGGRYADWDDIVTDCPGMYGEAGPIFPQEPDDYLKAGRWALQQTAPAMYGEVCRATAKDLHEEAGMLKRLRAGVRKAMKEVGE